MLMLAWLLSRRRSWRRRCRRIILTIAASPSASGRYRTIQSAFYLLHPALGTRRGGVLVFITMLAGCSKLQRDRLTLIAAPRCC